MKRKIVSNIANAKKIVIRSMFNCLFDVATLTEIN